MFYSSESSSDEEVISQKQKEREEQEKENLFRDPSESHDATPAKSEKTSKKKKSSAVDETQPSKNETSSQSFAVHPVSPSNSRARAAQKARELEEKRKARKTEMITVTDTPSRPSTAVKVDAWEEISPPTSPVTSTKKNKKDSEKPSVTEKGLAERGIAASFDPNEGKEDEIEEIQKPVIDVSDVRSFITQPAPKGPLIECRIERAKGLKHPNYYVFLESNDKFILAGRKRKKSKTANYLISLDKEDLSRRSGNYLGKVRSNFVGTEFVFFDKGEAPSGDGKEDLGVRQELGGVIYSSNVLGLKGPRKMKVLIPALNADDSRVCWKPKKEEDSMLEHFKKNETRDLIVLQNKSPTWNEETKSYVLDFNKRVKQASVKNFQLVYEDDRKITLNLFLSPADTVIMQFGRISDDSFALDFQHPLSLFQAFAIAVTSFDNKIACD